MLSTSFGAGSAAPETGGVEVVEPSRLCRGVLRSRTSGVATQSSLSAASIDDAAGASGVWETIADGMGTAGACARSATVDAGGDACGGCSEAAGAACARSVAAAGAADLAGVPVVEPAAAAAAARAAASDVDRPVDARPKVPPGGPTTFPPGRPAAADDSGGVVGAAARRLDGGGRALLPPAARAEPPPPEAEARRPPCGHSKPVEELSVLIADDGVQSPPSEGRLESSLDATLTTSSLARERPLQRKENLTRQGL